MAIPRAYVPGCGRGHDALFLAGLGWKVTAIDVAPETRGPTSEELVRAGGDFRVGDALGLDSEEGFELLFEHTFFCALDRELRGSWGAMVRRLLKPGGKLAVLVFPFDRPVDLEGPPWHTEAADLAALLGEGFPLVSDEPVVRAIERREWAERWAVFQRASE